MPTTMTIYVDPDASGAGDGTSWTDAYTSLATAVNTELSTPNVLTSSNLVTNDELAQFLCRSSSGTADTGTFPGVSSSWTTDTTRYLLFIADSGDYATADWDTNNYRIESTASTVFQNIFRDCVFEGLQIGLTSTGSQTLINWRTGGSNLRRMRNCHIRNLNLGGTTGGYVWGSTLAVHTGNCIFRDFDGTAISNSRSGGSDCAINACNFIDCGTAVGFSSTTEALVQNCLFTGNTTDTSGSMDANCDYNATDNSSLGYTANTNDRVSQTFTFQSGANNYALETTDTGALDHGVDLSSDSLYAIDDDITNTARVGTWSIGCWEDAGVASFEQDVFRFRNDDGSESAATWKAAENTNITGQVKETTFRLRITIDSTGADPDTATATLQYRRVGDADSEWRDVPLT